MAATDLSAEALPLVGFLTKRITLDSTANNAREIILPPWARRVSLFIVDGSAAIQSGAVASSGTDGAAIGTDYLPITSGGLTWRVAPGRATGGGSMYVSATTASSFAQLMLEQE
jgi:hypothetical protein|tara:strand:+ start:14771 stop:15112 length:342 start_codon:yes stop_codon:yes gene_type:complete